MASVLPILEGVNAVVGIASGFLDILDKLGVLPGDSEKFDKIFDALGKNYAAIENVGSKVDRNFIVTKAIYETARRTLSEIEETRYEMREGFQRVIDSIEDMRVNDKVSKVSVFMKDFFENEIHVIKKLSKREGFLKLRELSGAVTVSGGVLHDNLNDILEQGLAIPHANSAGDSVENEASFAAMHCLYYGTQVGVSVFFFVIEQYTRLAGEYYQEGEIEMYNEIYSALIADIFNFKGILSKSGAMIEKVIYVLEVVKMMPIVRIERNDIYEILPERIKSMQQVKEMLNKMELPLITEKPSKITGVPDFSKSKIATPILNWRNGLSLSYAIQYKYNNTYSRVGEWSDPVIINGKANPSLKIPAAGEDGRERIIFRKFGQGKAEIAGIIEDKDAIYFRDISRDVYDAAASISDEIKAIKEIRRLLKDGANTSDVYNNGRKAIHAAAQSNNFKIALELLRLNKNDINAQDANGYTPIYIAAEAGYEDFVKSLLDHGADPTIKTNLTLTPLHISAYKGYFPVVQTLILSNKVDINAADKEGFTPLHSAIFSDSSPTISTLLRSNKVNINAVSKEGLTPLHLTAIKMRHIDAAEILLRNNKTDINALSAGNLTALHFAASTGNLIATQVLLKNNQMNINADTAKNLTALHLAISLKKDEIAYELLNESKVNLNKRADGGVTALHMAAVMGRKNLTSTLLEKKASTEEKTKDGLTALHATSLLDKFEIIPILIENGADIEAKTVNGSTPLHLSAFAGNKNATSVLLRKGADVKVCDGNGEMPLHLALLKDRMEIVKLLIKRDAHLANIPNRLQQYPIHLASRFLELVEYLVEEADADVNVTDSNGYTPLHYAARYGQLVVVKYFVNVKNLVLWTAGASGVVPLHLAAEAGHLDVVKYIIDDKSVSEGTKDEFGNTCLHYASKNGKLNVVKYLCDVRNIDVNLKNGQSNTPSHLAAQSGYLDTLKYFIDDKHVDLNLAGYNRKSVLHFAVESGNLEMVIYLVHTKKADLNAKDNYKNTPLHLAAEDDRIEILKTLLDNGALIDAENYTTDTPLDVAAEKCHLDIIKYLAENGAGINRKDSSGVTPVQVAAYSGCLAAVKYLIDEKNADFNTKDELRRTSLHFAALGGNLEMVKYLIDEKGVVANPKDDNGETPLSIVAEEGSLMIVKYLIDEKGVGVDEKNNKGLTPLYLALWTKKWDVVKYLLEKKADVNIKNGEGKTCLYIASEYGNFDVVKKLVEMGAIIKTEDSNKRTPLHVAVIAQNIDIIKLLIENGADVNACDSSTFYGGTPLNYAVQYKNVDIVRYLINKGANVNAKDKSGTSTINCAAVSTLNLDIIKILVENKVNVNARDLAGRTPLFDASVYCKLEIVKFLSENGADVNIKDDSGYTAESFIVNQVIPRLNEKACYLELVKYLKSRRYTLKYLKTYIHKNNGNGANKIKDNSLKISDPNKKIRPFLYKTNCRIMSNIEYTIPDKKNINGNAYNLPVKRIQPQQTTPTGAINTTDMNGTLFLFNTLFRKITDQKHEPTPEIHISPLESQAVALNIVDEFEELAEEYKIPLNIDFVGVQKEIVGKIMGGKFREIPEALNSLIVETAKAAGFKSIEMIDFMNKFNEKLDVLLYQTMRQMRGFENVVVEMV